MTSSEFPLSGVIGVVSNNADEIELACKHGLQCVEMRPDLLLDKGLSVSEVMVMVERIVKSGLRCLFTMRRHDHGGKFTGSDREQMQWCLQAVAKGAHVVDVEWDSMCADELISQGIATILSYHDFSGMPSAIEMASITDRITRSAPAAIKLVPTATTFNDAVRILRWVAEADDDLPRIGFAMGAVGEFSRILTRSFGGPIAYAAFGAPVAPGQIAIEPLISCYHADKIHSQTHVVGIVGEEDAMQHRLNALNQSAQALQHDRIAVPLKIDQLAVLKKNAEFLRLDTVLISPSQAAWIPDLASEKISHTAVLAIDFTPDARNPVVRRIESEVEDYTKISA